MANATLNGVNRREFVQQAVSGALLAAGSGAVLAAGSANKDKEAVLAQIPKMHDANVKRLQDWIALPSIAAENRNYPQGPQYMADLARSAGFTDVTDHSDLRQAWCFRQARFGCPSDARRLLHV